MFKMSESDSQEPLSTISEGSFVILGQGSLPALENEDSNKSPNPGSSLKNNGTLNGYQSTESSINDKWQSKWWSRSSISEDEIQRKLDELIRENSQLKETLNQNNLAIKSQLDTFIMWQQEVLKTHETHKKKFLETKDLILKLRAENTNLKKHLEDASVSTPAVNGDDIYAQINKKPEDLDKLKQKIEEYKQMCTDLNEKNEDLGAENQKLKEELKLAKIEILKLNKELEDIGRENTFLKQKNDSANKNSIESSQYKSLPSSEARAQISNLFEQLEHEKGKVLKLTKELEKTKSNDSQSQCTKLSTTEKLNQYIDKLNNMNDSLDMQSQRFSSLQSWVSLAEDNLKENKISQGVEANLVCEINQLKSHLNQEENVVKEKQETLAELKSQFKKLLEDYKVLQSKLTSLKSNDTNVEKQKEEISSLLNKLEEKDKELTSKQEECDSLKEEIKKLNLECEEIAILRIQVQLYQNDFNDERAAREKLVGEKEAMAEQIRHLQNRLLALEGENSKKDDSGSPLESPGQKRKFMCPRCMVLFSELNKCEEHIEECLNNDFLN